MMFVPGQHFAQRSFAGRSSPRLSMTTDPAGSLHTRPRYPDGQTASPATPDVDPPPPRGCDRRTSVPRVALRLILLGSCAASVAAAGACGPGGDVQRAEAAVVTAKSPGQIGRRPGDSLTTRMDQARILGDPSARLWFVIVSDFQCPYCKQFHDQSFAALRQQYVSTGKVRFAYINFPLPIHANAWPSAEAAMCAGAQGKFWQMHDALFASQDRWAEKQPAAPVLDSVAKSIGVDAAAMDQCMSNPTVHALIESDRDRAERAGVTATPTIIIGSKLIQGALPTDVFRHTLDSALAAQH
jgi:protein-disulfide isomerase